MKCDFEIILVDDGSTDASASLCDEYANKYAHISVVHQANSGVSVARNTGIEKAKGEWLWFVDGDDFIEKDVCVDEAYDKLMIAMGCIWEENGVSTPMSASLTDVPYNTWRCMFRKSLVEQHGIRFTIGRRYAEDQEFIIRYMLKTGCYGNIGVINDNVYHYTVRPGSAITDGGRKCVMIKDVFAVWCRTLFAALRNGMICKSWVLGELMRMAKTLLVTIVR